MQERYSLVISRILNEIKLGEKNINRLLNIFSKYEFIVLDKELSFNQNSINREYVENWILDELKILDTAERTYKQKMDDYNKLINQPLKKIPFFSTLKKEMREENEKILEKKKCAIKPKLEIWLSRSEEKVIRDIKAEIERIQSKYIELKSQEEQLKIAERAKKPISQLGISFYVENRVKHSDIDDFVFGFLDVQEYNPKFKDLIWLDKVFLNIETYEGKIEFLKTEFSLSEEQCVLFIPIFFEKGEAIISNKIEILNSLESRIILEKDKLLMNKNNFGGFSGMRGKFLKTFRNNLEILSLEDYQTKPVPSEFYQSLQLKSLRECNIPIKIFTKYIEADQELFSALVRDCTKILEEISDEINEKNNPRIKKGIRRG